MRSLFYYLRLNNNNQAERGSGREKRVKKRAYKTQIRIKSGFILCQAGESSAYRLILYTHVCRCVFGSVVYYDSMYISGGGGEAQHAFTSNGMIWFCDTDDMIINITTIGLAFANTR